MAGSGTDREAPDLFAREIAGGVVGSDEVVDRAVEARTPVEDPPVDPGDVLQRDLQVQESGDGDLVGGVQDAAGVGPLLDAAEAELQRREPSGIRRLEGEAPERLEVETPQGARSGWWRA